MAFSFFKSTAWQLIAQTDAMTKILLTGLFTTSVICVAIIIFKIVIFRRHLQSLLALGKKIKQTRQFNDIIALGREFRDTLGGSFLINSLSDLKLILDGASKKGTSTTDERNATLDTDGIDTLELALSQTTTKLILDEESYLPVLSISAAAGPLIGLFGTVWGLIQAFLDISQERTADIATVAPGIAEALITTLGGLIVAVPALIAYHYLANQLRKIEHQLLDLGDKFLLTAKHTFLK